jgi:hypothetical protein
MGITRPIQRQAPKDLNRLGFISCVILSFFLLAVPLLVTCKTGFGNSTCVTYCIVFSLYTKNAIACAFSEVIEYLMMLQQKQNS